MGHDNGSTPATGVFTGEIPHLLHLAQLSFTILVFKTLQVMLC